MDSILITSDNQTQDMPNKQSLQHQNNNPLSNLLSSQKNNYFSQQSENHIPPELDHSYKQLQCFSLSFNKKDHFLTIYSEKKQNYVDHRVPTAISHPVQQQLKKYKQIRAQSKDGLHNNSDRDIFTLLLKNLKYQGQLNIHDKLVELIIDFKKSKKMIKNNETFGISLYFLNFIFNRNPYMIMIQAYVEFSKSKKIKSWSKSKIDFYKHAFYMKICQARNIMKNEKQNLGIEQIRSVIRFHRSEKSNNMNKN